MSNKSSNPPERRAWVELIHGLTRTGRLVRRARVVSEPLSDYARFEWAAARALDPVSKPDSDVTTLFACLRLALREIVPARRSQHLQLAGGIVPAVVDPASGRRIRELLGLDEVLHPELRLVDPELDGRVGHQALDQIAGLGDSEDRP